MPEEDVCIHIHDRKANRYGVRGWMIEGQYVDVGQCNACRLGASKHRKISKLQNSSKSPRGVRWTHGKFGGSPVEINTISHVLGYFY